MLSKLECFQQGQAQTQCALKVCWRFPSAHLLALHGTCALCSFCDLCPSQGPQQSVPTNQICCLSVCSSVVFLVLLAGKHNKFHFLEKYVFVLFVSTLPVKNCTVTLVAGTGTLNWFFCHIMSQMNSCASPIVTRCCTHKKLNQLAYKPKKVPHVFFKNKQLPKYSKNSVRYSQANQNPPCAKEG